MDMKHISGTVIPSQYFLITKEAYHQCEKCGHVDFNVDMHMLEKHDSVSSALKAYCTETRENRPCTVTIVMSEQGVTTYAKDATDIFEQMRQDDRDQHPRIWFGHVNAELI